jgi:hypothetical protein
VKRHLLLLAAMATCALVAGGGASAWASEAPTWLVSNTRYDCIKMLGGAYRSLTECLGGPKGGAEAWEREALPHVSGELKETQLVPATLLATDFTFRVPLTTITILCTHVTIDASLTGVRHGHAFFGALVSIECHVVGRTRAECHVTGIGDHEEEITMSVAGETIYLGSKEEAESEKGRMGELIEPPEGTKFTELELDGTNCPALEDPGKLEGDFAGEITPVSSMTKAGALSFPSEPIVVAWRWKKKGEVEKVNPALKMFGMTGGEATGKFTLEFGGFEWELMTS